MYASTEQSSTDRFSDFDIFTSTGRIEPISLRQEFLMVLYIPVENESTINALSSELEVL